MGSVPSRKEQIMPFDMSGYTGTPEAVNPDDGLKTLYIVVPCFNEEDALPETARTLRQQLYLLEGTGKISKRSKILLVDDGSRDKTWYIISRLCNQDENFAGIKLKQNRGHQLALLTGLYYASDKADFTLSIDADLQDDVEAIAPMVDKYLSGKDIVCGVRRSRDTDTFFKSFSARATYTAMRICGVKLIYDHADFRIMSAAAVKRLCMFDMSRPFLRGLILKLGLTVDTYKYDRLPRTAGESKYTLKKMIRLARDGFASKKLQPGNTLFTGEDYIETVMD